MTTMMMLTLTPRAVHLHQLITFDGGVYGATHPHRETWLRNLETEMAATAATRAQIGMAEDHWLHTLGQIVRVVGAAADFRVEFEFGGRHIVLRHPPHGGFDLDLASETYGEPMPRRAECRVWLGDAGYRLTAKTLCRAGEPTHELAPLPIQDILRCRRMRAQCAY